MFEISVSPLYLSPTLSPPSAIRDPSLSSIPYISLLIPLSFLRSLPLYLSPSHSRCPGGGGDNWVSSGIGGGGGASDPPNTDQSKYRQNFEITTHPNTSPNVLIHVIRQDQNKIGGANVIHVGIEIHACA